MPTKVLSGLPVKTISLADGWAYVAIDAEQNIAAKNMCLMLVPPVFLFPVLSGNHKFAVRLKNDVG